MSERIELKSFEEGLKLVANKELEEVCKLFQKDFDKELKMQGIYLSVLEISEGIKERIVDSINERYLELKSRISHLRKKGQEVSVEDYNLLRVPLKMKLFLVNFNCESYLVVISILSDTEKIISELEKDLELKEKEKEKRILEKEKAASL